MFFRTIHEHISLILLHSSMHFVVFDGWNPWFETIRWHFSIMVSYLARIYFPHAKTCLVNLCYLFFWMWSFLYFNWFNLNFIFPCRKEWLPRKTDVFSFSLISSSVQRSEGRTMHYDGGLLSCKFMARSFVLITFTLLYDLLPLITRYRKGSRPKA